MTDKISQWKQAKELCENLPDVSNNKQIELIKHSNADESIKQKAVSLIGNMDSDLKPVNVEKIFNTNKNKPNLIGKVIADYELIKLLGAGGMSSVYLAKRIQSGIQKFVALKILSPYATDDKYLELFNREQKSLAHLNHHSIVGFHHGGQTEDGTKYLVMDYVEDAIDVISYVQQNQFSLARIIELIKTIADAMVYAHKKGIIHRDLKSANILMDTNGTVKIVDFGISLIIDSHQTISDNSTRCFTLDIASPEQIQGKKVDQRTDVFSLGALFLQLLTGKQSLPKVQMSQYDPIEDHRHVKTVLKNSDLPLDLKNIVATAMHIDLNERYHQMQYFAQDLENYLNHQPVVATSDNLFYKAKKLFQRNRTVSLLSFFILAFAIIAFVLIQNYQVKNQNSAEKNTRTMAIIDALFEQADPFISGKNPKELIKALETIEQSQKAVLKIDPEFAYHFYQNMTEIYNQNANYEQALKSKRKSIAALKLYASDTDPLIAKRQLEEYKLLHATGDYSQSIIKTQLLLDKLLNNPLSDPEQILITYVTLSRGYGSSNKLKDELKIHQSAIEFINKHPDVNPEIQADFLGTMAISQYRNSNKEKANQLFEQAVEIFRTLPNRQKSLATTLRNYAATNVNYGDFTKAEDLFKQSIDVIIKFDPKHPTLASTYLRYASLLAKSNRLDQAEDLLNTAVEIFVEANDKVELANAYSYLSELALRKNNIGEATEHIISANKYMFSQRGLDHPKTLKNYNLSLWILLIEPYQGYAIQVINFLNETDYINSTQSKEYGLLEIQKAMMNQTAISNNQDISILSQYTFSESLITNHQKTDWLKQQISQSDKYSTLVNAFLNVWLMEITPNESKYAEFCLNSEDWMNTTMLVLKMDLINRCLSLAENNSFTQANNLKQILNKLQLHIIENKPKMKKFVDELTQMK